MKSHEPQRFSQAKEDLDLAKKKALKQAEKAMVKGDKKMNGFRIKDTEWDVDTGLKIFSRNKKPWLGYEWDMEWDIIGMLLTSENNCNKLTILRRY